MTPVSIHAIVSGRNILFDKFDGAGGHRLLLECWLALCLAYRSGDLRRIRRPFAGVYQLLARVRKTGSRGIESRKSCPFPGCLREGVFWTGRHGCHGKCQHSRVRQCGTRSLGACNSDLYGTLGITRQLLYQCCERGGPAISGIQQRDRFSEERERWYAIW